MKLYELDRGKHFIVVDDEVRVPPAAPIITTGDVLKLHNIDGMYSYCTDQYGNVKHLAAWTEVEEAAPIP